MLDMPRKRPPHLQKEIVNGVTYWYVRKNRNQPRIRILGEYGSETFREAYEAAIAGLPLTPRKGISGSLEWLFQQWKKSSAWIMTKEATKTQRENIMDRVIAKAGNPPYAAITEKHIKNGREDRMQTPAAANNYLKTMRALFNWAMEAEYVTENPAAKVKFLSVETQGFAPWTLDDVAAFRQKWAMGTRERLALELILTTGLRRGDAVSVGRQHIKDGMIRMKAEKTGVDLVIPVLPTLEEAMKACPSKGLFIIETAHGRQWAKESFGTWFRQVCIDAGLHGKNAHGLRKLLASVYALDGANELQLRHQFGWQTNHQSLIYTKAASQELAAKDAGKRLTGNVLFPIKRRK